MVVKTTSTYTYYCDCCGKSQRFEFVRTQGKNELYVCTVCNVQKAFAVR